MDWFDLLAVQGTLKSLLQPCLGRSADSGPYRLWCCWHAGRCRCSLPAWRGRLERPSRCPCSGTRWPGARSLCFPREHELFESRDGQGHLSPGRVREAAGEPKGPGGLVHLSAAGCCQVPDTLEDRERHHHTPHGHVCSFCRRAFPSGHPLDTRILEWHAPPSRSRSGAGHVPLPGGGLHGGVRDQQRPGEAPVTHPLTLQTPALISQEKAEAQLAGVNRSHGGGPGALGRRRHGSLL